MAFFSEQKKFKILINLKGKQLEEFKKNTFQIYEVQKEKWEKVNEKSILNYDFLFFKIEDPETKKNFYYIVQNCFIVVENQNVKIFIFDKYLKLKSSKYQNKRIIDELKKDKKKLSYLFSYLELFDDYEKINEFEDLNLKIKTKELILNFNLEVV